MNADHLLQKYVFWPEINNEFHKNIDFSKTSIEEVADKLFASSAIDKLDNQHLRDYILKFYGYSEYLKSLRDYQHGFIDKDTVVIFEHYQQFIDDFAKKMFSYLLYCCLSEARHSDFIKQNDHDYRHAILESYIEHLSQDFSSPEYHHYLALHQGKNNIDYPFALFLKETLSVQDVSKDFETHYLESQVQSVMMSFKDYKLHRNENFKAFLHFIYQLESFSAHSNIDGEGGFLQRFLATTKQLQNSPIAHLPIENLLEYLGVLFKQGFRANPGFGGSMWSEISQHALDYAKGKINTEMFLDKAFSLEHNSGHIFNKDYIFNEYTERLSIEWFDGQYTPHYISLDQNELLFNLQNSSSVLFFFADHLEKLSYLADKNNLVPIVGLIKERLKSQNITIEDNQALSLASSMCKQSIHFLKTFNILLKHNEPFLSLLQDKHLKSVSTRFDFGRFLISYYKSKKSKITQKKAQQYEKDILQSLPIVNLFSDLLTNVIPLNIPKKIALTQPVIDVEPSYHFYSLDHHSTQHLSKEMIGSKAYGLAEMMNLGLNVPKAMVFDSYTCLSYLKNPKGFHSFFQAHAETFEAFLQEEQPILISVRSGAAISMPGMMDTILNVGIDDSTYPHLVKQYGKKMIDQCAITFMEQFCTSTFEQHIKFSSQLDKALDQFAHLLIKHDIPCHRRDAFPLKAIEQIQYSIESVFRSWNSLRAVAWRTENNISDYLGTSATLQKMVFGNQNKQSFTAVIFSRDCITGHNDLMGEYLIQAQGDDLVSGKKTPLPISELKMSDPHMYQSILQIAKQLEEKEKAIQDIEMTIQDNELFVLQKRNAVVTPEAKLLLTKDLKLNILDNIHIDSLIGTLKINTKEEPYAIGLSANPGVISGVVVKSAEDIKKYRHFNKPFIFMTEQALPEHAQMMIDTDAFITQHGGATSHAAILARSMNKPCIVGLGNVQLRAGSLITLDAGLGQIWNKEQPIFTQQKQSEKLAQQVLKENNIVLSKDNPPEFHQLTLSSWLSSLSYSHVVNPARQKHQYKTFLSLAQKTAAVLLTEEKKKQHSII